VHAANVCLHFFNFSDIESPLPSLEERTKSLGRRRATTIIKQQEEELELSTMIVQEGSPILHVVIKQEADPFFSNSQLLLLSIRDVTVTIISAPWLQKSRT